MQITFHQADMLELGKNEAAKGKITVVHAFSSEDQYRGSGQLGHLLRNTSLKNRSPPDGIYPIGEKEVKTYCLSASHDQSGTEMFFVFSPCVKWGVSKMTYDEKIEVMEARASAVRAAAMSLNAETLVLGAWGCGIYGVPDRVSAQVQFDKILTGGGFKSVLFGFTDRKQRLAFELERNAWQKKSQA
jgi:hypothetical protein